MALASVDARDHGGIQAHASDSMESRRPPIRRSLSVYAAPRGRHVMTEPAVPKRRRLGFSEIPRKVRWIIHAKAPGGGGFGYLMIFITAYSPQIGIGPGTIGLILGAEGASMVVCAVPLGIYSDRRGRKAPLLVASAVLPPTILVFALTTELPWLVLAAVVAGVAEGGFLATWNAIIADQTTTEQRNAAFALAFILGNVAGGLGFALPILFPALEAWTGLDSRTVHVTVLLVTDAFGFLVPIVLIVLF